MARVNLGRIRTVFKGEWAAGAYEVDDVVLYAGSAYTCIAIAASGNDPTDAAFWIKSSGGTEFMGAWDTAVTYSVDQMVTFNGSTYIAITAHSATQPNPTGQTDWGVIAAGGITSFPSLTSIPTTIAGYGITDSASTPTDVGLGNLSSSGNNLAGDFTATGNITAYSDERLKSNIEVIHNALEKVLSIRGVTYDMNNKRGTGVIAQELEKVLPEAVKDDEFGMKSVAYGNIIGLLVESIKEQQVQIDRLMGEK
jgi:hypothetical protein